MSTNRKIAELQFEGIEYGEIFETQEGFLVMKLKAFPFHWSGEMSVKIVAEPRTPSSGFDWSDFIV